MKYMSGTTNWKSGTHREEKPNLQRAELKRRGEEEGEGDLFDEAAAMHDENHIIPEKYTFSLADAREKHNLTHVVGPSMVE